ncbi:MAG TPA: MIP family channel protein [Longimicrobiaceae bacterium]|nr:MIP family channel protein [Longimicrobiaceae bacterium]
MSGSAARGGMRRALAEGIGTFFLVLIGPGAAMVNAYTEGVVGHAGVALAFAFVVLAMIYALGHISGAHINPAVTLAFWSVGRFPAREVVPYVLAQCAGAVAASLALGAVLGPAGMFGATLPAVGVGGSLGVEWLLSFVLMLVIMAVATDARVAPGFAGIAVGLTVGFCAMMGGPLTGASMNPARSLGPAVAGWIWAGHWIYWVAPVTGMLAAARTYEFLRPADSAATVPRGVALGVEGPIAAE